MSEPEPEPEAVSAETNAKILQQIEFYFGDANLPTDKFLLKTMKKDPDRWVDLSVIAGFNLVKKLSKSTAVIAAALQPSELLEVSDDLTRLRRTKPLPAADTSAVRTVVAENIDRDSTIDSMTAAFGACGAVKLVKILTPEQQQQDRKAYKHPAICGRATVGLVQYATEEEAIEACDKLDEGRTNWRGGLRVSVLEKGKK
eukprot:SAG22_NODE_4286_length_1317_cov_1.249589_1_plen_199_part_10